MECAGIQKVKTRKVEKKMLEELKKEELDAVAQYTEIHRAIRRMQDDEEKEILERKYLMQQTWEKIAEEIGCDRRTAMRKHGNALKNFKIPESCHCMSP